MAQVSKKTVQTQTSKAKQDEEKDLWGLSKDCGCDCGCCSQNQFMVKKAPQYYVNEEGALKAGKKIAEKHLGLKGKELDEYVEQNVADLWHIYDVLGVDAVEVEQMSSFYKRMLKDPTAQIQ